MTRSNGDRFVLVRMKRPDESLAQRRVSTSCVTDRQSCIPQNIGTVDLKCANVFVVLDGEILHTPTETRATSNYSGDTLNVTPRSNQ